MATVLAVFVGHSGVGKSTLAEMMTDEDHRVVSSDLLMKEFVKLGLKSTHENIHAMAMAKIAEDPSWQAKQVLPLARGKGLFIFDGPRNPHDVDFLIQAHPDTTVVALLAPMSVRYRRLVAREGRLVDPAAFLLRCINETLEAGLGACLRRAGLVVFNRGVSLDELGGYAGFLRSALISGFCEPHNHLMITTEPEADPLQLFWHLERVVLETNGYPVVQKENVAGFLEQYLTSERAVFEALRAGELSNEFFESYLKERGEL